MHKDVVIHNIRCGDMHQDVEGLDWMYLVICRRIKLNVIFLWGATSYRFECLILKFKNMSVKSFYILNFELNFKCYDTLNWKKSKRGLRWCHLFAVVARKLQNYHLNCPKELCRLLCSVCCCIVVCTHCDRALHCEWFEHLEGVGAS